jgi:hypothetical protein
MFIMAYVTSSTNLNRILEDMNYTRKKGIIKNIIFFLVATARFMQKLKAHYRSESMTKPDKAADPVLTRIVNAVHLNWLNTGQIEAETTSMLEIKHITRSFLTIPNAWGCLYLTGLVLILSL